MRPLLFVPALLLPLAMLRAQPEERRLEEVVIASTPLGRSLLEQAQAVSVLEGAALSQALAAGLGDTLAKLPGVASTGFAPGANRPVIRGLGEDRIRLLNNGVNLLDVSNVSPDHAVTVDPLLLDRIEVVRGPAALRYGPNGVGGVVNAGDGRIPQTRVEPGLGELPLRGRVDSRYGSGADAWSGAAQGDVGVGPLVFHFDGFRRDAADLAIPGEARSARRQRLDPLPPGESEARGHIPNSFSNSAGGAAGASYFWEGGYFGLARSFLDATYGTVAEEAVTIDMAQERWEGRGALDRPLPGIAELSFSFGASDYDHTEYEGAEVGTVFLIEGYDARVELRHEKLGPFEGALGYQANHSDFSALGAEAFLPPVENESHAAFLFEEVVQGDLRWQMGLRFDHSEVRPGPLAEGARDQAFGALSGSAGAVWSLPQDYSLAFQTALTQRAPTYVELLADGPHLATGAYERGDPGLELERSLGFDLTLRKSSGWVTGSLSAFHNRFENYIGLFPTGEGYAFEEDGAWSELPIYAYEAVPAHFTGGEVEATLHLLGPEPSAAASPAGEGQQPAGKASAAPAAGPRLDLQWQADYVDARQRGAGGALPRMPPFRTSAALIVKTARFTGRLEGQFAAAQQRTADFELPTDASFLLHLGLSYRLLEGPLTVDLFARASNLLNAEARQHTSFLKDIAPSEGRALLVGLQAAF